MSIRTAAVSESGIPYLHSPRKGGMRSSFWGMHQFGGFFRLSAVDLSLPSVPHCRLPEAAVPVLSFLNQTDFKIQDR